MFTLFLSLLMALPVSLEAKKLPPMVEQVSRTRFEVSQAALERRVKNPYAQLSTFRALPSFGTGFFSGIEVSGFSKNCLLPDFGLQDGDVIEMVNGQPIRGPGDIREVGEKLAKARPGAKVRVHLRRGHEDVIHTYLLVE